MLREYVIKNSKKDLDYLRTDILKWSTDVICGELGKHYLNLDLEDEENIVWFETLLVLVQIDMLNDGLKPILVTKVYIENNVVYHKYISEIIRNEKDIGVVGSLKLELTGCIEYVERYKNQSIDLLKNELYNKIHSTVLDDKYFIVGKYKGPDIEAMIKAMNTTKSFKKVNFIKHLIILGIIILINALIRQYFNFIGVSNTSQNFINDSIFFFIIILIFTFKPVYNSYKKYQKYLKINELTFNKKQNIVDEIYFKYGVKFTFKYYIKNLFAMVFIYFAIYMYSDKNLQSAILIVSSWISTPVVIYVINCLKNRIYVDYELKMPSENIMDKFFKLLLSSILIIVLFCYSFVFSLIGIAYLYFSRLKDKNENEVSKC